MSFPRATPPKRRGFTLPEVMIAGAIMMGIMAVLSSFSIFLTRAWHVGMADTSTQLSGELALQRIGPSIRMARGVVLASSGTTRLTLQLPAYDSSGAMIAPMQNGQIISYYLSDSSGRIGVSGNILWRSVNGIPDSAWSLRSGQGRTTVSPGGLTFSYYPAADPVSVTVSLRTTHTSGSAASEFPVRQDFLIRNKGF